MAAREILEVREAGIQPRLLGLDTCHTTLRRERVLPATDPRVIAQRALGIRADLTCLG
jgi:hypothetical protein